MSAFPVLVAAALALAVQSTPDLTGSWVFATDDYSAPGVPVCTETWTFEGDRLTIHSGEEVVEKTWRLEASGPGHALITQTVSTNGRADCQGDMVTMTVAVERTTFLMFNNGGTAVVCSEPDRMPDGSMFIGPTCYGSLRPTR